MSLTPETIVLRVSKIASLPEVYFKIEQTINAPNCSNKMLAAIIEEDLGLTARLLRLANSAFYNFAAKIETVNQAITVLGTQQLRDLALACSVLKAFSGVSSDYVDMEQFWRHSIACGLAARLLASQRLEGNVERYFVAGLLHDIGRLVLLMELPNKINAAFQQAGQQQIMLYRAEREQLGFNHAYLGALLLKHWKLSPRLVEAIAYHHAPAGAMQFPIDAAMIHCADIIANGLAMGSSGERLVPKLNDAAWQSLELSAEAIEQVVSALKNQYSDAVRTLLD